jgi:UDP-N-acetylglucosamine 2-epimerase (non-hydrolysing)
VETVELGWNVLAGCDRQHILEAVRTMRPPSGSAAPYGNGRAAERIVSSITTL